MAHREVRPVAACSVTESLKHIAFAIAVVVIVYLLAGIIADGAVGAIRYLTG